MGRGFEATANKGKSTRNVMSCKRNIWNAIWEIAPGGKS